MYFQEKQRGLGRKAFPPKERPFRHTKINGRKSAYASEKDAQRAAQRAAQRVGRRVANFWLPACLPACVDSRERVAPRVPWRHEAADGAGAVQWFLPAIDRQRASAHHCSQRLGSQLLHASLPGISRRTRQSHRAQNCPL